MADQEAISPEDHERASAVARTLMRLPYKPLEQNKKGGPMQQVQSADPVESDESDVLLKEKSPPKE